MDTMVTSDLSSQTQLNAASFYNTYVPKATANRRPNSLCLWKRCRAGCSMPRVLQNLACAKISPCNIYAPLPRFDAMLCCMGTPCKHVIITCSSCEDGTCLDSKADLERVGTVSGKKGLQQACCLPRHFRDPVPMQYISPHSSTTNTHRSYFMCWLLGGSSWLICCCFWASHVSHFVATPGLCRFLGITTHRC